jgi:hypothetical protein
MGDAGKSGSRLAKLVRWPLAKLAALRGWGIFWAAVVGLLAVVVIMQAAGLSLRLPFAPEGTGSGPVARPLPPGEFLYLDSERALAYLAQMQGGTTESEQLSSKLTKSVSGKLVLKDLFEGGSAEEGESRTERQITPTAASSYVELLDALMANHEVANVQLACASCMEALQEGTFVEFRTDSMRPPLYVNPYLAVRQSATLSALFPMDSTDTAQREVVGAQREAAHKFAKQVGEDPRIVFALQPDQGGERGPHYLLPLQYRQLSPERSLIKYGGGEFTVLGKLVRRFPEQTRSPRQKEEAYVDSPVRETWQLPLKGAIGPLLCRADPGCQEAVQGAKPSARAKTIRETRKDMETALLSQSQIHRRGAVILPIAIYK